MLCEVNSFVHLHYKALCRICQTKYCGLHIIMNHCALLFLCTTHEKLFFHPRDQTSESVIGRKTIHWPSISTSSVSPMR